MEKDEKLINHLLLEAKDSSAALANLNRLRKSLADTWSLQLACRKIGIPSTGYYSDVMKGKRTLHPKYLGGVSKAFGLTLLQSQYFAALIHRDQALDTDAYPAKAEEVTQLANQLKTEFIVLPQQLADGLYWHIIVLSAFSLYGGEPSLKDLEGFFGKAAAIPLGRTLQKLQSLGLVEKNGERYIFTKPRLIFSDSADGLSHVEFLEKATMHAAHQIRHWFPRSKESMFVSSVVTVDKQTFEAKLPELQSRIYSLLGEMHAEKGDQLVEFNLQLFPFDPKEFQR